MKRNLVLSVIALLCLAAGNTIAQDPFQVAPGAYRLELENDWVKVARVHYGPKEKLPAHDHPRAGTVFVYLNDGGPVRFSHVHEGDPPFPLIRPATTAGAFRLARAVAEHHEVENLSELPNDFLRVELKTEPVDAKHFQGRFLPDKPPSNKSEQTVAFENGQVRIVRIACASGDDCDVTGAPELPALLIALTPVRVVVSKKDRAGAPAAMTLGQTEWLAPGDNATLRNSARDTVRQLRIEFKSGPSKADEGARDE